MPEGSGCLRNRRTSRRHDNRSRNFARNALSNSGAFDGSVMLACLGHPDSGGRVIYRFATGFAPEITDRSLRCRFKTIELRPALCLLADVTGALKEGETGMRCGPTGPNPQLPPQL